ncbi:MAG: hypothetical protein WBQ26_12050 [Gemmatimonadaceae bacterium]
MRSFFESRVPCRRVLWAVALLVGAAACERGTSSRRADEKPPEAPGGVLTVGGSPTVAAPVAPDSIPRGVREALAAQAPDFQPWSVDNYRPAGVGEDSAGTSGGQVRSVVHAHFRGPGAEDYVLVGYDRRLHSLRIVAVLADTGTGFTVISVSEGPERPDSVAGQADRYLAVDTTAVAGACDLLVIPVLGNAAFVTERYTWVGDRAAFLLVSPN